MKWFIPLQGAVRKLIGRSRSDQRGPRTLGICCSTRYLRRGRLDRQLAVFEASSRFVDPMVACRDHSLLFDDLGLKGPLVGQGLLEVLGVLLRVDFNEYFTLLDAAVVGDV